MKGCGLRVAGCGLQVLRPFRFRGIVFGSGDCPTMYLTWGRLEVGTELRAWRYQKSWSPSLSS
jgi:hypothetical protein